MKINASITAPVRIAAPKEAIGDAARSMLEADAGALPVYGRTGSVG
jgi:hypothetical protein